MPRPKRTKPAPIPPPPPYPRVVETFSEPALGPAFTHLRIDDRPSCFNDRVSIRRYRVTVERIEEPVEVLAARLRELWETSDNHHDYEPLQEAARGLGVELDPRAFRSRKKGAGHDPR